MQKLSDTKIIIIGSTHHNTLSMVRCFGEKGLRVDVILIDEFPKRSYVTKSKYINMVYRCKADYEILQILEIALSSSSCPPIIIACTDQVASIMDINYDTFKDRCVFFNCKDTGLLTMNMDKFLQSETASQCNIKVPLSKILSVGFDSATFNSFPCIVKPLESIHGGKKINICNNPTELSKAISGYSEGDTVLLQEFIKRDYEIVIVGLSLDDKCIIPGFIRKHRDRAGGTNYSTVYDSKNLPNTLLHSVEAFVERTNYRGLWGVEFIIRNGEYYFIELNLRNDATTYSIACAGINLPYVYYLAAVGEDYKQEVEKELQSVNSIVEYRDLDDVLRLKVSPIRWLREYRNSKCRYFHSNEDPAPAEVARTEWIKDKFKSLKNRL